jgi:hypothetical protein
MTAETAVLPGTGWKPALAPPAGLVWPAESGEHRFAAREVLEDWRPIPGHPGYEASDHGRVRSIDRLIPDGRRLRGRVLKLFKANAYLYVSLGKSAKRGVHRVVALAFFGLPPSSKHEAAHWDGNTLNNRASNIRWATRAENEQDKRRHGTYARPINFFKPGQKKRGPPRSRHPQADAILKRRSEGATFAMIAADFGKSKSGAYWVLKWRT